MPLFPILFNRNNFVQHMWVVLILGLIFNGKILLMKKNHSIHWRRIHLFNFIYFGWNDAIQFYVKKTQIVSVVLVCM